MAAITNNVESHELDAGEFERSDIETSGGALRGLGAAAVNQKSLAKSHTMLTKFAWLRTLLERELQKRSYSLVREGNGQYNFYVKPGFDKNTLPWAPFSFDGYDRFGLWSVNNAKMACPSFALPAGGLLTGGTCPGADAGQTISPVQQRVARLESQPDGWHLKVNAPGSNVKPLVKEGLTICSSCVAGDALVLVRGQGLVPIGQLAGLGMVEVWSGKAWRETHAVFNGVLPTFLVTLADGRTIRVTGDHNFIAVDNTRIPAAELQEGEALPWELPEQVAFPKEAYVPQVQLGEQYRTEKRGELPSKWTHELGLWLGYIVGDGWFYKHEKYPTIGLCAAEQDRSDLDRINTWVKDWTGSTAEVTVSVPEQSGILVNCAAPQNMAKVLWRQKSAVALAQVLGLNKAKDETRTPEAVWSASQEGVAGYLSGLFSTDGSVGFRGAGVEISFATVSRRLADEVRQLLFAFGIKTSLCKYKSNEERGYLPLWKVSLTCHNSIMRFRECIGFFNQRKAKKLEDFIASPKFSHVERRTHAHVESVVSTGKLEPVFDLVNVGPEHQFTANGISISNCYATGGNFAYANNQVREIICYWWLRKHLQAGNEKMLLEVIVDSITHLPFKRTFVHKKKNKTTGRTEVVGTFHERTNIKPIRLHDSGDFFSQKYAELWIQVADALAERMPEVVIWAPTRTWAQGGWSEFWAARLGALRSLKTAGRPNLVVRASGYNFGDAAPGQLHPANAKGTTSLFATHAKVDEALRNRTDATQVGLTQGAEARVDFNCGVYGAEKHSCVGSKAPDGKVGCRACWIHPELSVNYSAH